MVDAPDTQTPPNLPAVALELLAMPTARYRETFQHKHVPPKPLAIGISAHLVQDLALDPAIVHATMRLYTRRRAYQQALARPGALRVDLAGQPVEPVAPEHQTSARTRPAARPGQGTPTPAAGAAALTWEEVQTLTQTLATAPAGEARTMKLTLVGRPGKIETRQQCVVFRMQGKAPGSLPKGLPPMPPTAPLTWVVMVATRQWSRIKDAISAHPEDSIIVEGYPVMQGTQPVLMAQSCTSVALQRAQREAQKPPVGEQGAEPTA